MSDEEPDFSGLFARKSTHLSENKPKHKAKKASTPATKDTLAPAKRKKDKQAGGGEKQRLTGVKRSAAGFPEEQVTQPPPVASRDPLVDGCRAPPTKKTRVEEKFWPFEVDYNDHFETSSRAIHDIKPVLCHLCKRLKKTPAQLVIYDPFYCKGGIRRHYEALGFTNFIHRNRDFYQDVAAGALPQYDILVTNPPYSADHKERILDHCLRSGKPWALLLPNYVATKAYFGQLLESASTPAPQRPFFLTPTVRYTYDHPEGTGHAESPFFSIWYVGLGQHTEAVYGACRSRLDAAAAAGGGSSWDVALARSVEALRAARAVPTAKRLNPKQRMRLKKRQGGG